jgi:hypothetical protein
MGNHDLYSDSGFTFVFQSSSTTFGAGCLAAPRLWETPVALRAPSVPHNSKCQQPIQLQNNLHIKCYSADQGKALPSRPSPGPSSRLQRSSVAHLNLQNSLETSSHSHGWPVHKNNLMAHPFQPANECAL